jgi:molybdopterin synthase catalytic subunit
VGYLTREPLDPAPLLSEVRRDGDGGLALFVGVVRNEAEGRPVSGLLYEAYEGMAEKEMAAALSRVSKAHPGARVLARHRIGLLRVGDVAVVVAASAPHREEAFAACRAGIDEIKRAVPIWKKEFGPQGALWVDPRAER